MVDNKPWGFPTTLCGRFDSPSGNGCADCCYGQVVTTSRANWGRISGSLTPQVFKTATKRAHQRIINTDPELLPAIIETKYHNYPDSSEGYVEGFIGLTDNRRPLDEKLPNFIRQHQTLNPKAYNLHTPAEALEITHIFYENFEELNKPQSKMQTALINTLINAASNQSRDLRRPLTEREIIDFLNMLHINSSPAQDYPCPFLNTNKNSCTIYDNKPDTCDVLGAYCPAEANVAACGANHLFSCLNQERMPLSIDQVMASVPQLKPNDVIPLEFFLVNTLAQMEPSYKKSPYAFFNGKSRKRH